MDEQRQGLLALEGLLDADLAEMGRNGRAFVEEWVSPTGVAAAYAELFEELDPARAIHDPRALDLAGRGLRALGLDGRRRRLAVDRAGGGRLDLRLHLSQAHPRRPLCHRH